MINPDPTNDIFSKAVAFVNQTNQHLFITGKAGTGKTTFLKYIKENTFKKMAVVAPTGVAAINAGGVTIHSFFQLPFGAFIPSIKHAWGESNTGINNPATLLKNLKMGNEKQSIIRELELLIIDEVSMVRADMLDAIDTVLRHFRKSSQPFGGVQMIYIGDLYQLPPVIKRQEWEILRDYYNSEFFFSALSIQQTQPILIELKKIYRQSDDIFINVLNNVRNNCCTEEDIELLHQYYKPGFVPFREDNYIVLTTHNQKADAINQSELQRLPEKEHTFEALIKGDFYENSYPAEKSLRLKAGAQIMFIKNDKGESRRYFNGKIGTIKSINTGKIIIGFPNDTDLELKQEIWQNIRYKYDQENDTIDEEEQGSFTQYPIRLAWAITIHKSQGLTFEKAIIDAGAAFAPGQVYVSLSRLTRLDGMVLYSRIHPSSITTDPRVQDFSKSEIDHEELQRLLEIEQQVFIQQSLVKIFDWQKMESAAIDHLNTYQHRQLSDVEQCIDWAQYLLGLIRDQKTIAEKFGKQLSGLLAESEANGTDELTVRIKAAVEYFIKQIDQKLLPWIKTQVVTVKAQKKNKKYLKDIVALQAMIEHKKQKLQQAVAMADALYKGSEVEKILALAQKKADPVVIPEVAIIHEKKPRPIKGDSSRTTLNMFHEGKSITDIAKERTLSPATIYSHLIDFIKTGEFDVYQLMDDEKVERIINAKETATDPGLSPIKTMLGDEYSWDEIRAVLAHVAFHENVE